MVVKKKSIKKKIVKRKIEKKVTKKKAVKKKVTKNIVKKTINTKNIKLKPQRSRRAKNLTERVQRKWLYQCAYWRVCGSCSMRDQCAKMVKDFGLKKSWLTDQILGTEEQEVEPIKVKPNSRFLTEKEWLNSEN